MAAPEDFPELKRFVLHNVRLTGIKISSGAYGSVEEVAVPGAIYAAKRIHGGSVSDIRKAKAQFVGECQLMSTLRHPNIVQFIGVTFFSDSRLPAPVMERLVTSLHNLLDSQSMSPPDPSKPLFPLSQKCAVLTDVANGLAYLHEHWPSTIHRELTARNVFLNAEMVAKIAVLDVARIVPAAVTTMTKEPGAVVYMPPEAMERKLEGEENAIFKNTSIFSFGVIAIFTLCQTFPNKLLAATYRKGQQYIARTELERRERYMRMIRRQLREKHPLLQMIEGCLDFPEDRPSIGEVLRLLEKARAEVKDEHTDTNKLELLQALHIEPRTQSEDKHSSLAAEELPTIIDKLPISEEEKIERIEESSKKRIEILITGKIRAGKSTLMNAIVGKEVAKPGKKLHTEKVNAMCYKMETEEGMDVEVWDSPGLHNGSENEEEYLTQLKEKYSNVDIIIYCINISATRSEFREGQNDISAIKKLTATFGPQWWKHSIFVMTFANLLETMLKTQLDVRQGVVLELEQQSQLEEMFNDRILEWKVAIHGALLATGVPWDMVNEVPVVPAGVFIEPHLPGHDYWLSQLRSVLLNISKQQCQRMKLDQLRIVEQPTILTLPLWPNVIDQQGRKRTGLRTLTVVTGGAVVGILAWAATGSVIVGTLALALSGFWLYWRLLRD